MEKLKAISPFQLFSIMFVSSVFCSMMYSQYLIGSMDLLMYAAASIMMIAVMLLLTIPLVVFSKSTENANIIKAIQIKKPVLSWIFTLIYSLYFKYSAVVSMTIFALLLSSFINPGISFAAFFAAVIICCYYASFKGLTSISRSGTVFFVMTVIALIFICFSLGFKINTLNYSRIFLENGKGLFSNIVLLAAQASGIPAVFMFVHRIKGDIKKPLYLWIVVSYIVIFLISLVSYGVLDDYLHFTPFPFYTATQLTEIGAFQRLDVIFLALWTIGLFVNVSLSMFALRETLQSSFRAGKTKYYNPLSAIIIGVSALIAVNNDTVREYIFNDGLMFLSFITAAFVLPLIAVLLLKSKKVNPSKARLAAVLVLALLAVPFFAGCDKVQLQERLLIKGIGIDGSDGNYSVTIQYIDNYSEDEGQSNKAVKVSGSTIGDAMNNIRNATGSEPFLGQNVAIIVGWDTAKGNIKSMLDYFVRCYDSRPTVKLFLSETTAEDILTLEVSGKLIPIDNISEISPSGKDGENLFTLLNFINQSESSMDSPTASVLKVENNSVTLSTVAVFGGSSGLYKLDSEQLATYQIVNGIAQGEVIFFDGISCEVNECKATVKAEEQDSRLKFDVSSELTLNILENPQGKSNDEIETLFTDEIKKMVTRCMETTINDNKNDIYSLGKNLRWNDYRVYAEAQDYGSELEKSKISINIKCKIANLTG